MSSAHHNFSEGAFQGPLVPSQNRWFAGVIRSFRGPGPDQWSEEHCELPQWGLECFRAF